MSAERDREPLSTVLSQASVPAGAVFLSYASEDADAAERIATALRSAGIQVWLDKSELRGGDAWGRQICQQIHDCRLFMAVISAHTEARDEGYFRREWKMAIDRTHDMAENKAFIVPVVVDGTSERGASVPDKFRELQWTRLPCGDTSPAFVERVRRLLLPDTLPTRAATAHVGSKTLHLSAPPIRESPISKPTLWVASAVVAVALRYFVVDKFWISKQLKSATLPAGTVAEQEPQRPSAAPGKEATFNPSPHSIAVLPFVNMSGDKEQEYFSEGLTEELLNSLSRINELQVAARTSSFSFQGEHPDIATVAHKLNVGAVLEGSVRRSANTVRITASASLSTSLQQGSCRAGPGPRAAKKRNTRGAHGDPACPAGATRDCATSPRCSMT
jgi:TolB-like protein